MSIQRYTHIQINAIAEGLEGCGSICQAKGNDEEFIMAQGGRKSRVFNRSWVHRDLPKAVLEV